MTTKNSDNKQRRAQIEAVRELATYDHAFLPKRIVTRLTRPFGFGGETSVHYADPPGTFKGLRLPHGMTSMDGCDADYLARQICHHLHVDYAFDFGRGAMLREACSKLLAHLGVQQ